MTFERFGGLNLVQDPQETGAEQATSRLNVTSDRHGRLRSRDGYDYLYSTAGNGAITSMHPVSDGVVIAADIDNNEVKVINLGTGFVVATSAGFNSSAASFASIDGAIYFTDGTGAQVKKYTGGAFSSPAGLAGLEGNHLAVQPLDDRLVIADANNTDLLRFSDAATPETFSAGNTLELTPGDGEPITGMEVFGTELFVFKKTKFFVFYGNSTDSTGGAIFNYRMVDTGIGCDATNDSYNTVAHHETGLYFLGYDGIYRTAGGAPEKISRAIDPVFKGSNLPIPAPFSSTLAAPLDQVYQVFVARDELWVVGVQSNALKQFVMDLATGEWTHYNMSVYAVLDGALIADFNDTGSYRGSVLLGGIEPGGSFRGFIAKSSRSITDDEGSAISWHHQSGFYDLGSQTSKRTRQTALWGSGSPTVSVLTDHGSTDANAAAVTLGTAPAVERGWHRKAYRGVLFSHKLSGTAAATVHRIAHAVADQRGTS